MLAVGGRMLASGSDDDFATEEPPRSLLDKTCGEGQPRAKEYHKWSWTKERQGARAYMRAKTWPKSRMAHWKRS